MLNSGLTKFIGINLAYQGNEVGERNSLNKQHQSRLDIT